MGDIRHDLLTVVNAMLAIRSDDASYDAETRACARDLWCLALELLRRHERRIALEGGASPTLLNLG